MTIDSLIAVLGLAAAIFAIMPRERQLDLQLRLRATDWTLIGLALLAIHYLIFFRVFLSWGLSPGFRLYRYSLHPPFVAYLVVLFVVLAIVVRVGTFKLSASKVASFKNLLDELANEQRYAHLFSLLEKHLDALYEIAKGNKKKGPTKGAEDGEHNSPAAIASETLRSIQTAEKTTEAIAKYRPYLGLRLLSRGSSRARFSEQYLRVLLQQPGSIWYSEIKNNQNMLASHRYIINPENRLIHFLLSNTNTAYSLEVYRPIGNYILSDLDRRARMGADDDYNWAMDDFYDDGKWRSPIWTGIFFFDIMVSEALWQGVEWHMWLYYYPLFVEGIVRNFDQNVDDLIDPNTEWPTKYSFLLYEIVSTLRDWISESATVPGEQANVMMRSHSLTHENGNIPKSAIIALGQAIKKIALSPKIPVRLKNYLIGIAYSLYFDLYNNDARKAYASVLRSSLVNGGVYVSESERPLLVDTLLHAFASFAQIPQRMQDSQSVFEFEAFLRSNRGA